MLLSKTTIAAKNAAERRNNIVEGRHPVVESGMKGAFVPNNVQLDQKDNRLLIITGPNMAGKSTYLRQVAIITLMAHIGSFVPGKKGRNNHSGQNIYPHRSIG